MKGPCLVVICSALLLQAAPALQSQTTGEERARQAAAPQGTVPSAQSAAAPPAAAQGLVLKDGTPVKMELTRELSSADAHAGDLVDFQVVEDVKVGNSVVIPMGGVAWAKITAAQHKRHMGRAGKLNLAMDTVRLADGEKAHVRTVREAKGERHVEVMAAAMVATGLLFFPAAPLYLFVEGEDVTIPEGTELTAYVDGDVPLDAAKFTPETPGGEAARRAAAFAMIQQRRDRYMVAFQVESEPAGAEIRVDGKLMGETPSLLQLRMGKHAFELEKHGYEAWDDVLDVGKKTTTKITINLNKK